MPSKSKENTALDVHASEFRPKHKTAEAARELFKNIAAEELQDEEYF
jgi:hypothetical protein